MNLNNTETKIIPTLPIKKTFRFNCNECNHRTNKKSNFDMHRRVHNGEKPYPCLHPGCTYRAGQRSDLTRHHRTHTGEKPYRCTVCDWKNSQNKVAEHYRDKHPGVAPPAKKRVVHQPIQHVPKPVVNAMVAAQYAVDSGQVHLSAAHAVDAVNAMIAAPSPHMYNTHLVGGVKRKAVDVLSSGAVSSVSSSSSSSSSSLSSDTSSAIPPAAITSAAIPSAALQPVTIYNGLSSEVGSSSSSSGSNKKMKVSYCCAYAGCEYVSTQRCHVVNHTRVHTGEKPFICHFPNCTYKASRKHHLVYHLRSHSDEKQFACTEKCTKTGTTCTYRTKYKSDLNLHKRIHTGEKNFACMFPGCTYKASQRGNLIRHLKTHVSLDNTYENILSKYTTPFKRGPRPQKKKTASSGSAEQAPVVEPDAAAVPAPVLVQTTGVLNEASHGFGGGVLL